MKNRGNKEYYEDESIGRIIAKANKAKLDPLLADEKEILEKINNLKVEKEEVKPQVETQKEIEDAENIKNAENFDQLIVVLGKIEKIPSPSRQFFTGEEMLAVIKDLISENPTLTINHVTSGYGLRDKVEQLLQAEHANNPEESELDKIEKRLNEARENYSREYVAYIQSQKKPSSLNKIWAALGMAKKEEEVKSSEAYLESKKEYDEALSAMGQYLFDAKKSQLDRISAGAEQLSEDEMGFLIEEFNAEVIGPTSARKQGKIDDLKAGKLTDVERNLLLRNYKSGSIFQKVVLDEHNLLTEKSIEMQPKSEKGKTRETFEKAVKFFASQPTWVKTTVGWGTIIGVGVMTSGVSLPILATTKIIAMSSSMLAAKGVGWLADNVSFLKDGSGKRYEKTMQDVRSAFAGGEKSIQEAMTATSGAKSTQYNEAAKYRLARTLWMAAAGAWTGVGVRDFLNSHPLPKINVAHAAVPITPEHATNHVIDTHPTEVHHAGGHVTNHPVHTAHHAEKMPAWKHNALGLDRGHNPLWKSLSQNLEKQHGYHQLNPMQKFYATHSAYYDVVRNRPVQFHSYISHAGNFHDSHQIQHIISDQRRLESFKLRNYSHLPKQVSENLTFKMHHLHYNYN